MAYTETAKEKEKREAYYKANKERGIRAEKQKEYEMFGTTEQNIPKVDTMGNVTGMKKGGKVMSKKAKRYDDGGEVEFETKTGRNENIGDDTRARAMKFIEEGGQEEVASPKAKASSTPKGAKAFTRAETGGGAALMTRKDRSDMPKAAPKAAKKSSFTADHTMGMAMKKGGAVRSSASKRADGIAIRGKTRA